jgi:cyclopropane fatty-acyl-phospholipid synthase-like methyltransferase
LSIIKRHIPQDRNQVIVDLGCGSGAYLYFLRERGYTDLRGVDISTEQVDLAHKLGLMSVERNSIEAYAASLPNHSVDVILLMDVLEHMGRQEIFFLLDNVIRILKPGGRCLLHVPNAEGLFGMRVR